MWVAIWILMRREGVVNLKPVLLISFAICLLSIIALRFFGAWGLIPVIGGLMFALIQWCFLSWWKALIVAVIWLLATVGFGTFVSPVF